MTAKEFKATTGISNWESSQNVITQAITTNSATTIDTVALNSFYSIRYDISIVQGSKIRTSRVSVQTDGTSVDSTEYGIVATGGAISGVAITATASAGNMLLQITVTDAATTIARVRATKNLLGVIQPYLPGAPTIGTISGSTGTITIPFTAPADNGNSAITSYTATSNPAGYNTTGASSPLTATGIPIGTSFSYTVSATNSVGTGAASASSNSVSLVDSSWWGTFTHSTGESGWDYTPYINPTTGSVASKFDFKRGNFGTFALSMISANPPAKVHIAKNLSSNGWYKQVQDVIIDDSNNTYIAVTSNSTTGTYSSGIFKVNSNGSAGGGLVLSGNTNLFTLTPGAQGYHMGNGVLRNGFIYTRGAGSVVFKIPTSLSGITWQKTLSGIGNIMSVGVDASDNVYAIGDGNIAVKLDSSGNLVWQKSFTFPNGAAMDAVVSKNGTCYVVGYANNGAQTVVIKINSSGVFQWVKNIPFGTGYFPRGILTDLNDNVYIVHNSLLDKVKLSASGSFIWNRTFTAGSGLNQDFTYVVDDNGAVYINVRQSASPYQAYFAKFPGDGSKTGTYTIGTWAAGATKTISDGSTTVADSTSVSVSNASYTTSSGYPTGISVDPTNFAANSFTYTAL